MVVLNGLCQEDIAAVLGRFCSEGITCCLYPWIKCSRRLMKISKNVHQGALTIAIFFADFACVALKLEKVGPILLRFNPYSLLPCIATDDRKQFQCSNVVSENKTGPLFLEFNRWENSFSFLKR